MTPRVSQPIHPELFAAFFRDGLRVWLDWDAVASNGWPVTLSLLDVRNDLEDLYVPWYLARKREEVDYGHPEASPLRLAEIPQNLEALEEERRNLIRAFAVEFAGSTEPVRLTIPCYALDQQRSLVLDGNHRLAALVCAAAPFRILRFTLHGPLDPDVLPDLVHFGPGSPRTDEEHRHLAG